MSTPAACACSRNAMSRRGTVLLGLGGVVATGSIVVLILGSNLSTSDSSRPAPPRVTPWSTPSSPRPVPDSLSGRVNDGDLNRALRTSEASNLDPQLEQPMLALAKLALLADLTGVGRERFPDYLPGHRPTRVYQEARVQAGVARRVNAVTVEAHLVWAAKSPDGEYVERQTAIVRLQHVGQSWVPIRS